MLKNGFVVERQILLGSRSAHSRAYTCGGYNDPTAGVRGKLLLRHGRFAARRLRRYFSGAGIIKNDSPFLIIPISLRARSSILSRPDFRSLTSTASTRLRSRNWALLAS